MAVLRYFHQDPRQTSVQESSVIDKQGTVLTQKLTTINQSITNNTQVLEDKQNSVPGKSLSTNDFTDEYKNKLRGIEEGAEVNVQSDWGEDDDTADSYIKNKPVIDDIVTQNSENLITSGAVFTAIDELPEPMIFKGSLGTGGTIQTLPAPSADNVGFVYKVITAGAYYGITAKPGDAFISDSSDWILIPSGDEPEGTVMSVGLSVPTGLQVSGSPITTSGTLAITYALGYAIPTTAKQDEWDSKQDAISDLSTIRSNASNGNTAYGWGNHANAGYQAAISDLATIRSNASEGHTAYGWGNHANAGYVKSSGVTSVAMTVPTGLSISGSPITSTGTLALSFANGYSIPTTAKQSNWDTAYGWGNHANAGYVKSSGVTKISTTDGVVGGDITTTGTIKANLASYTKNTSDIGGKLYAVQLDKSGRLAVNVPWTDHYAWSDITGKPSSYYTLPLAASGTRGGVQIGFTTDAANRNYAVQLSGEKMYVHVPWTDNNTTYNFAGISFTSGQSNTGEHNANNITTNGHWYYTSNGPAKSIGASTDNGALYSQAYSTAWVGQIAQDYRNGNLFTRGKNNGTWQSWRKVMYTGDALTKSQVTTALGYTPPTTDTNTWRGITDSYSGTDSSISLSQKGGKALYDALVNGYANSAGNADTVDSEHASAFAHRAAANNLVHAGNEITMIPDSYSGSLWLNYQSVGRNSSSNITEYIFGNGKGEQLAKITSGTFNGNCTGSAGSVAWTNVSGRPTNLNQFTNGPGYITGITKAMVTNALGYTPPTSDTNNAVTQTNTATTNASYRVLMSVTADDTTRTEGARKSTNLQFNPSAGKLSVSQSIRNTDKHNRSGGWNTYEQGRGISVYDCTGSSDRGAPSNYYATGLHVAGQYWFQLAFERGDNRLLYRGGNAEGVTRSWSRIHTYGDNEYACVGKMWIQCDTYDSHVIIGAEEKTDTTAGPWVGIGKVNPSYKLHVNGACGATSHPTTSDVRIKDIQSDVSINLEDIANAPLFLFKWKEGGDNLTHVGTSAQYWKEKVPELVSEANDERKTLSLEYEVLGTAGSIAIAKEVVSLKEEIKLLQAQIAELKQLLNN